MFNLSTKDTSVFCLFLLAIFVITGIGVNVINENYVFPIDESQETFSDCSHSYHASSQFCSVSPYPDPTTIVQPDGSNFQGLLVVEEGLVYLETMDGYAVLQDVADKYYKYAVPGLDGDLFLSGATVSAIEERDAGEEVFLTVITTHLRYTGIAKQKKKDKNASMRNISGPDGPQGVFPPTGTQKALLILIDFPDQLATYSVEEFEDLANQVGYNVNNQTGSFRDYYLAVSYGLLTINTDVVGWHTAANDRATYGIESLQDRNFMNAVPLIREAVDFAEVSGVDFSQYDGDGDGRVDVVEVIHSGRGAEESGNVDDIWSHRWVLSGNNQSVTYDDVLVNDYIIQAEKLGTTNIANIGVLVHEFGHALGLPDLYDTNGGSSGLGRWAVMSGGTWNNGGRTPSNMTVWCKDQLGWVNKTVLSGTGSITDMDYLENANQVYQMNTADPDEYFLLENRFRTGWDEYIPGDGLLIFHIDESRSGNADETRYKVHLEQADGNEDLNNGNNSGDTNDPFSGASGNGVFDCFTTPNSNDYSGTASDVSISNITVTNNLVSFDYGVCFVDCTILGISDAGTGVNNFNNVSYDYEITVSHRNPPGTGTIDVTAAGMTFNASIATSPQTINLVGLPADGNDVDVTVSFSEDMACTATVNALFVAPESCSNDDICDAIDITAHINGEAVRCNNLSATVQTGEPAPIANSCSSQYSWCESTLSNTVWFKFTAPASGSIDIDFTTAIDLQMALWEVDNCGDILDANQRMMVAANDDNGTAGGYSPRITQTCLIPGREYFVQMDGYNGTTGLFNFTIVDNGVSCGAAPTATAGCVTNHTVSSGGHGEWMHVADANGDVIVSINDKRNNLGSINVNYAINNGAIRTNGNLPYLDRDWQITPTNNAAACVRLYLTDAELNSLNAGGGPSSLADYLVSKLEGTACSDFSTTGTTLSPTDYVVNFENNKHMIQFDVDGFSTFFAHGVASALPVELSSFKGEVATESNVLTWITHSEENTCKHVVERSDVTGKDWTEIGHVTSANTTRHQKTYTFEDRQPLLVAYYRIKTVDCDGRMTYSDVLRLERSEKDLGWIAVYPVPTQETLNVSYTMPKAGDLSYTIRDLSGRLVSQQRITTEGGIQTLSIDVSDLAKGAYILILQDEETQVHRRFVKG